MTTKGIINTLETLSSEYLPILIEALNEKTCRVELDHFTCEINNEGIIHTLWIANGLDSFECYSNKFNSFKLFLENDTEKRTELWRAIRKYVDEISYKKTVFEPKKVEVKEEDSDPIPF